MTMTIRLIFKQRIIIRLICRTIRPIFKHGLADDNNNNNNNNNNGNNDKNDNNNNNNNSTINTKNTIISAYNH